MESDVTRESAGVLCFTKHAGQVFLVLGREQYVRGWKGSLRWSEFGGKSKSGETGDPVQTAGREFFEETLGVLGNVTTSLQNGEYLFKITISRRFRERVAKRVLFIKEIPYSPRAALCFQERREHLKQILFSVARIREIQRSMYALRLPVPDFLYKVGDRMTLVTNLISVFQCVDDSHHVRIQATYTKGAHYFRCPERSRRTSLSSDHSQSSLSENEEEAIAPEPIVIEEFVEPIDAHAAESYAKLIALKSWLDRLLASFPTVLVTRCIVKRNHSWLPFVKKDFLEKDELRMWTLQEISEDIEKGNSAVRTSFKTPLRLVVQQLEAARKADWPDKMPIMI